VYRQLAGNSPEREVADPYFCYSRSRRGVREEISVRLWADCRKVLQRWAVSQKGTSWESGCHFRGARVIRPTDTIESRVSGVNAESGTIFTLDWFYYNYERITLGLEFGRVETATC
jgi:hypothetical protein